MEFVATSDGSAVCQFCENQMGSKFWKQLISELDKSTARRLMKSSRALSGTSAHPTMVT